MSLVTTLRIGGLTCHALHGGTFALDGGAMFGVVPRTLWERRIAPDDRNRIPLRLTCLLIEHPAGPILIETGLGNKEQERFREIYVVANAGRRGPTQVEDALAELGLTPGEVRYVVNTHLHFDHAGGNTTVPQPGAGPAPTYPAATYVVQRRELEFALRPNERSAPNYLGANIAPIGEADRWHLVDGETELVPGVRLVPTPGHVPGHQSVLISDGGETACFLGDLIPTTAHLPLPWIAGLDVEPLVTLETKRRLLQRAAEEGWVLVFAHDTSHPLGRAVRDGKSYGYAPLDTPAGAP